jgi:hypothetical protein
MKKLLGIAVMAAAGVAMSWGATTNILFQQEITIKGELIPSGATVSNESLSGNSDPILFLDLAIIDGMTTNEVFGIGQVTTDVGVTNVVVLLTEGQFVDLQPKNKKTNKYISTLMGSAGSASNAMILLIGTEKADESVTSAQITGVWVASTAAGGWTNGQAIVGTMMPTKRRR